MSRYLRQAITERAASMLQSRRSRGIGARGRGNNNNNYDATECVGALVVVVNSKVRRYPRLAGFLA